MGASWTAELGAGKTLDQAFRQARAAAAVEHGHGYSGSLAEKDGCVEFATKPGFRITASQVADLVSGAMSHLQTLRMSGEERAWEVKRIKALTPARRADERRYATRDRKDWERLAQVLGSQQLADRMCRIADDKWGPAVALLDGKVKGRRGLSQWLFFGMASS